MLHFVCWWKVFVVVVVRVIRARLVAAARILGAVDEAGPELVGWYGCANGARSGGGACKFRLGKDIVERKKKPYKINWGKLVL